MRAEATIALVGVQPTLMQVPPINYFSISAVFQPALASFLLNGVSPCPEPIMIASKVFILIFLRQQLLLKTKANPLFYCLLKLK